MIMQILKTIGILLEVVLLFNIIIIVHELGHFWAARWRGMVVEKFGIWFGKPIWKKKIDGVEYSLGCIPAGGFVALPQLAPMEAMEGKTETDRAQLPPVSATDKIIVAAAGPVFSFGLAIIFAIIVWMVGKPVAEGESKTEIGYLVESSPAYEAGLRIGDKIIEVDGHPVSRFGGMTRSVVWHVIRSEGNTVPVLIERNGEQQIIEVTPNQEKAAIWKRRPLRQIGIAPRQTPMVARVQPGTAAEKAGLQPNDLVVKVNGQTVYHNFQLASLSSGNGAMDTWTIDRGGQMLEVQMPASHPSIAEIFPGSPAEGAALKSGDIIVAANGVPVHSQTSITTIVQGNPTEPVVLDLLRGGQPLQITVRPAREKESGNPMLGFVWNPELSDLGILWDEYGRLGVIHPTPWEQIRDASSTIVNMLSAVLSPKSDIKPQHLSGPVGIMRLYYMLFDSPEGWRYVLWFSVILNVNLALMNLLPIPVLDGGHIMLALIEKIRGRAVNLRVLEFVQSACALLLIGFMIYVTFFDVQDLPLPFKKERPRLEFVPIESAS